MVIFYFTVSFYCLCMAYITTRAALSNVKFKSVVASSFMFKDGD